MYRGMGALNNRECRANSLCAAVQNAYCYSAGYFTPTCGAWRSGIDGPVPIAAPPIDTQPGSPTYGQATVNGRPVETPEDIDVMLDAQIEEQRRRQAEATLEDFTRLSESPFWLGYLGGALPDLKDFKLPDFMPVALVVAAVAALSIAKH